MRVLEVTDLRKRYAMGRIDAVAGVSFEVRQGESLGRSAPRLVDLHASAVGIFGHCDDIWHYAVQPPRHVMIARRRAATRHAGPSLLKVIPPAAQDLRRRRSVRARYAEATPSGIS